MDVRCKGRCSIERPIKIKCDCSHVEVHLSLCPFDMSGIKAMFLTNTVSRLTNNVNNSV